jgi:hypothetical protein
MPRDGIMSRAAAKVWAVRLHFPRRQRPEYPNVKAWLNWRTAVASILLALVFTSFLWLFSERSLTLSGLDLFFAITTVISIGFNLWQLFRDRYKYEPLKNSFIGLFNDIKSRQLRAHFRQQLLTSSAGTAASAEQLRLEFYDFAEETKQSLDQIREHVVAAIHTLDNSISSQQVFKAADFGMSEEEKRQRAEGFKKYMERLDAERERRPPPPPAA